MENNSVCSPDKGSNRPRVPRLTCLGIVASAATCLLIGVSLAGDQRTDLLAKFREQSIPVEAIELEGDVVTARLVYGQGAERTSARTEEEMLILFSRIAESYPESKRIVLDLYAGAVRISEIEVETKSALSYGQGKSSARELLGSARMAAHLDVEKTMKEAIAPRTTTEAPPVETLPEKIIPGSERSLSSVGTTSPTYGGGGGPAAGTSISAPWPLLGLLALLLVNSGLIIALVLRRRRTAPGFQKVSARIEVSYQDGGRKTFEIRQVRTTVGRAEDNSLVIHDSDVSSHHAEILISGGTFVLRDLASANGTLLNGEEIREARLYLGDEIVLGSTKLTIGS